MSNLPSWVRAFFPEVSDGTTVYPSRASVVFPGAMVVDDPTNNAVKVSSGEDLFTKAMAGATYVLAPDEALAGTIKVTGTGTNVVKLPSTLRGYRRYVWNAGSGTLAVQDSNGVAAAALLAAGTGALFLFTNGVKQLTPSFTVA